MISIIEFKKALGPLAEQLSEEQIEEIRVTQDRFADIFFDDWLKKVNGDRVLASQPVRDSM